MPNFRLLGSIITKKYLKVAYPLKKSRLLFFGFFDLESGRIKNEVGHGTLIIFINICSYIHLIHKLFHILISKGQMQGMLRWECIMSSPMQIRHLKIIHPQNHKFTSLGKKI